VKPTIEVNYRPKSDDPDRRCGICQNFQPLPGSDGDGNCFGHPVTVEGLCTFFMPQPGREAASPANGQAMR